MNHPDQPLAARPPLDMTEVHRLIDSSALFPEQIVYFKGLHTLDDVRREIASIEASNRGAPGHWHVRLSQPFRKLTAARAGKSRGAQAGSR